jgi:hypothetical protein
MYLLLPRVDVATEEIVEAGEQRRRDAAAEPEETVAREGLPLRRVHPCCRFHTLPTLVITGYM